MPEGSQASDAEGDQIQARPLRPSRGSLYVAIVDSDGRLRRTNRDCREAFGEYPALMPVLVDVHRRGEGRSAGTESRITFKYVAKG
jgi:hypothetical protein